MGEILVTLIKECKRNISLTAWRSKCLAHMIRAATESSDTVMSEPAASRSRHSGHFIKQWREYRQMTQEQVAAEIGRSQSWIAQLESGALAYTQQRLEELAALFRCTPADLISLDPTGLNSDQIELVHQIVRLSKGHSPDVVDRAFQIAHELLETRQS